MRNSYTKLPVQTQSKTGAVPPTEADADESQAGYSHSKLAPFVVSILALACLTPLVGAQSYCTNQDPQLALYIQQALDRNPGIRQSFAQYRASLQRLPQVSALPDPVLGITQYVRSVETRVGPQTTMLSISQHLPWFGKLSDKEKIAAKEAAVVRQQYEADKQEVIRRVKIAYYNLAYIDRAVAITEEDRGILERYEKLAEARYSQGAGLQQQAVKLQAEITRDVNRLQSLAIRRADVEAALNGLLDRPAVSPVARVELRPVPKVAVDINTLYQTARAQRPEVLASLLQIERDEERIHLARRNYWPDFTLGANFVNVDERSDPAGILNPPAQNGKNVYSVTASVAIPIHRRKYDAAVLEATEDQIGSREGYRSLLNSVEASIRATGFRIQTLTEQIALFQHTLIPQAQQALRSTEAAYSTGTLGVLDLLDSERVLLDVRLGLAQMNSDYMKSLADMERTTGAAFPEIQP